MLLAAGCGAQSQSGPAATVSPFTPTPAPTSEVPGEYGNPIAIMIRGDARSDEQAAAADTLTQTIKTKTSLEVEVVLVDHYADALGALCASRQGRAAAAWLDGIAYYAAQAQGCGMPALQAAGDSASRAGQIVFSRQLGTADLRAINGRVFCRLNYQDFYSWLLPVLVFETQNIDLLNAAQSVEDYPDVPALLGSVASGDCAAAGTADNALAVYDDALTEDVTSRISTAFTTVPFPQGILLYPIEIEVGVKLALNEAFVTAAADPDTVDAVRLLLGAAEFASAQASDFATLLDFMRSTGLDFSQLGG